MRAQTKIKDTQGKRQFDPVTTIHISNNREREYNTIMRGINVVFTVNSLNTEAISVAG
jgi:hypothetical protein